MHIHILFECTHVCIYVHIHMQHLCAFNRVACLHICCHNPLCTRGQGFLFSFNSALKFSLPQNFHRSSFPSDSIAKNVNMRLSKYSYINKYLYICTYFYANTRLLVVLKLTPQNAIGRLQCEINLFTFIT